MTIELFLQSILIYTVFGWGMFKFAQIGTVQRDGVIQNNHVPVKAITCCVLLFALVSGIRWGVGMDYFSYLNTYESSLQAGMVTRRPDELGWNLILGLLIGLKCHYSVFFGVVAFLQILFISLTFKKEPAVFVYVALFCVLGDYYLTMMNGLRQALACCSFIWAARFIADKKIVPFVIWLIVAVTFHKSVIIVAPMFFLVFDKLVWNKRIFLYGIFVACIIAGYSSIITRFFDRFSIILEFLKYDSYVDRFDEFFDVREFSNAAWGPIRLSRTLIGIIIIYFYPKVADYYKSKYVNIVFKLYFFGLCVNSVVVNTTYLLERPFMYFTFFGLPMTAYTIVYLLKQGYQYRIISTVFLILVMTPLYWAVFKGFRSPLLSDAIFQFCFSSSKVFLRPF